MRWLLVVGAALIASIAVQERSDYVGPAACASCHSEIAKSYQSVTMSRTFAPIVEAPPLEDWTQKNRFYHEPSRQHFVMTRRGNRFFQRRYQVDAQKREINSFEQEIHFAIGSGKKERDYLQRTSAGELLQLPVVWYSDEKTWGMAPGYDRPDHDNFSRRVVYRCVFCHNAYPKLEPGADRYEAALAIYPAEMPKGIDCERCHGPGGRHVREGTAASIVNPAKLDRKLQLDVCMQCHLETTSASLPNSVVKFGRAVFSYRPGESLGAYAAYFDYPNASSRDSFNIVHQAYRLRQSACFIKSEMTCTTCHDPHRKPENPAAHFREKCAGCHEMPRAHDQDCIGCHMPQRRTDDVVHVVMTDHRIQRRPPRDLLKMKAEPNHANYRGDLSFYFPEPERDAYLGAALARGANVRRGIEMLERVRPRPNFELAAAYAESGDHGKAVRDFEAGLKADPAYAEGWYNLGLSLLALNQDIAARSAFESAVRLKPVLADAHAALGIVATRAAEIDRARRAYLEAIRVDPLNVVSLTNLALLERSAGNIELGSKYIEQVRRVKPNGGQR